MIRKFIRVALTMAAISGVTVPALAITDGIPDSENTNVALVLFTFPDGVRGRCSGPLIAPDVVLTAGHCTDGVSNPIVSFDFIRALDPEEPGISEQERAARLAHFISGGTPVTDPAYDGTLGGNGNDRGAIRMPQGSVQAKYPGINPAPLPPVGFLDQVNNGALKNSVFILSGFGDTLGANSILIPAVQRNMTTAGVQNVQGELVKFQGNASNSQDAGGACLGDSGGPALLNGYVVASASFVNSLTCVNSGYQRTDTPHARSFLDSFLN